jgi:hypothetical protein
MCALRISALSQPTLPFSGTSVPETLLWPDLPEAVRSRALMVLANLVARRAAADMSPASRDVGPSARESTPGDRGECR